MIFFDKLLLWLLKGDEIEKLFLFGDLAILLGLFIEKLLLSVNFDFGTGVPDLFLIPKIPFDEGKLLNFLLLLSPE